MRYEDQKLIREYCRLGLAIAAAKNPGTKHDVSEAHTLQRGYMLLKARMDQLSPKKKAAYRAFMQGEIHAVRELITKAKATGEDFSLADIEIETKDLETGEAIPDRPNVQLQEQDNDPSNDNGSGSIPEQQTQAHAQAGGSDDGHQSAGGDREDPRKGP